MIVHMLRMWTVCLAAFLFTNLYHGFHLFYLRDLKELFQKVEYGQDDDEDLPHKGRHALLHLDQVPDRLAALMRPEAVVVEGAVVQDVSNALTGPKCM